MSGALRLFATLSTPAVLLSASAVAQPAPANLTVSSPSISSPASAALDFLEVRHHAMDESEICRVNDPEDDLVPGLVSCRINPKPRAKGDNPFGFPFSNPCPCHAAYGPKTCSLPDLHGDYDGTVVALEQAGLVHVTKGRTAGGFDDATGTGSGVAMVGCSRG